jgi:hypothetical protein
LPGRKAACTNLFAGPLNQLDGRQGGGSFRAGACCLWSWCGRHRHLQATAVSGALSS